MFALRPVTFRYKKDPEERKQFGLIAEEVEEVLPELVVHDADGNPEAVLYHELPAMLLNEWQKQQTQIAALEVEANDLRTRIDLGQRQARVRRDRLDELLRRVDALTSRRSVDSR